MSENLLKAQNFLARSTIKSYEDGQLFLNYDQLIHAVNKDSIFLEQLIVANPKIYINLLRYNNGQLKKKRQRKLFESLYKYYKRSYLRSTPFGLFSEGCNTVCIWSAADTARAVMCYLKHTQIYKICI